MIYLSFSTYSAYRDCPLMLYYRKNYPLKANYAELEIGKFMHRYFYRLLGHNGIEISADEAWRNIKMGKRIVREFEPEASTVEELAEEYSALGNHIILRRDEDEYIKRIESEMENSKYIVEEIKTQPINFEKHVSERYGDITFHGYIDILFEELIGEIKTGFESDKDREQVKFYSLILYLKNYRVINGRVYYLLSGNKKDYKFKVGELENLLEDAVNVANNIKNGNFEGNKGSVCNYCPYRDVCEIHT